MPVKTFVHVDHQNGRVLGTYLLLERGQDAPTVDVDHLEYLMVKMLSAMMDCDGGDGGRGVDIFSEPKS